MADLSSFFQKCVYFSILMFIFILLVNFIIALNIFGVVAIGPATGGDPGTYAQSIFGIPISTTDLWSLAFGVAAIGAIGIGLVTGSTTVVGVYLFSVVFWTGFINMYGIFGSLFVGTMSLFLGIGFAVVLIVFIAAIIGMLSGSG